MRRVPRVNQLIKKELAQLILREIDFPDNVLVTLTRVDTSANLIQAKVYVSVMPEEKLPNVLEILNKSIFELQQMLNRRLRMRPIPKIIFMEERITKEAGRIEELLEEIRSKNN
jgi:ribosome-binding factor A